MLFTATLKLRLKLSKLNTVVSRFISQRLNECKSLITKSAIIRKRLHIDFLSILIRVVLSLKQAILSLKSRDHVLITIAKETTKETIAISGAIKNTKG